MSDEFGYAKAFVKNLRGACDEIDSLRAKLAQAEKERAAESVSRMGERAVLYRKIAEVEKERDALSENLWIANKAAVDAEARVAELELDRDKATTSQAEDLVTCVRAVQESEAREAILREALERIAAGRDGEGPGKVARVALEKAAP